MVKPMKLKNGLFFCAWMLALCFAAQARAEFITSSITSGEGANTLYGSLLIPGHKVKPPVILLISGSGPTDRDGNSPALQGKNDGLKMLAEELAIAGFASVRYDKRGIGESFAAGKSEAELRFQTYVADVQLWVKQLNADPRFSGVAIVGHSEGSSVGMLAAQSSDVAAYVSLAGPARSASKILRTQLQEKLPPDLLKLNETILSKLEKGELVQEIPAPLLALYRPSVQPYLISWFKVTPADVIKTLKMPVAIFQGDTDIQVSVSEALLLSKSQPMAQLHVIKGMNHILKQVPMDIKQQVASYSDPYLYLDPSFVNPLINFLKKSFAQK
jgi:pimeloyl-ACP methyl ester carboxylesterase